jgi:hypothetical protein
MRGTKRVQPVIYVFSVILLYVAALIILHYIATWKLWDFQKMGSVPQALATLIGAVVLIFGWNVSNSQSLERDILAKRREQSFAVAEYVALARSLTETDNQQNYRRANQLAWQLFLWLPADVYRQLGKGLSNPANPEELIASLVAIRKSILEDDAGTLGPDDIIVHAPGIGRLGTKP